MRRLAWPILAALLVASGLLLTAGAEAHAPRATLAAASPEAGERFAAVPAQLRAGPAPTAIPWLLVGLGAGVALASAGLRPRPTAVAVLTVALVVLALENGIHSVHHLGDREGTTCVVAAAVGHLTAVIDGEVSTVHAPVMPARLLAERPVARPCGPSPGRDPARAPPVPIA